MAAATDLADEDIVNATTITPSSSPAPLVLHTVDERQFYQALPLAGTICLVVVLYSLLVFSAVFIRQLLLSRQDRTIDTTSCCKLDTIHCSCFNTLQSPFSWCCSICQTSQKPDTPSFLHRMTSGFKERFCSGPSLGCPSSVRCCGLEIRRAPPLDPSSDSSVTAPATSTAVVAGSC